jgi:serine/threonine protein kinase/WD40 repeat protein
MSESLDRFVRDVFSDDSAEMPTQVIAPSGNHSGADLGALPGHAVEGFIARGGMGAVYRARQVALEREVAVKVMTGAADSPEMAARFRQEALVLGRLEHPNIVPIHELGTDEEGQLYYTMKLVKGRTLQHLLNDLRQEDKEMLRQYSLAALLTIFRKVCDALAFAHAQGVLHRDLKPDNVMVGEFGEVLVMDWGLAKLLRHQDERAIPMDEASAEGATPWTHGATLNGAVMGTPQYMSPEQAMGWVDELDERSDLFSLGGILYAILTLRPPVEGSTLEEVLEKVRTASIRPPTSFGTVTASKGAKATKAQVLEAAKITPLPHLPAGRMPAALSAVAMKALRLEKAERYASVAELSADIEKYQGGFATSAEQAGAMRQLKLLMLRHKAVTVSLAAMLLLSVGFVLKVMASEREAKHQAAIAEANERRAEENEKRALTQQEETRRALMKSQIAVAEAAFRSGDRQMMVQALDSVPDDLRDQVWQYLSAKRNGSLGTLHLGGVAAVARVPGQLDWFALARTGGELQIWNVRTEKKVWQVAIGFQGLMVLSLTHDGALIAVTAKGAKEIQLRSTADGSLVRKLPSPSGTIERLVFSPDAKLLAVGGPLGHTHSIMMMNTSDGTVNWQQQHGQAGMDFSVDGSHLFVSSNGQLRALRLFEATSGKLVKSVDLNGYSQGLSSDGKLLAVGLHNGEVAVFDAVTGNEVRRAKLFDGVVHALAWSAGDHLLIEGREGGMSMTSKSRRLLRLYDAKTFALRGTFFGLSEGLERRGWAYQPESGWLITEESNPQRWQIAADGETFRFVQSSEQGWSVTFPTDSLLLYRRRFSLGLCDLTLPHEPRLLPYTTPQADVIGASHWRSGLTAIGKGIDSAPFGVRIHSSDPTMPIKREIPLPHPLLGLDFDLPGDRLLAVLRSPPSLVLEVSSGEVLVTLPEAFQRGAFAGVAGHVVAIVDAHNEEGETMDAVALFDGKTGEPLRREAQQYRINALAVSADRRLIAIAGEEQVLQVLDADTLEERYRFRAHDDDIRALAFHPQLPVLASASNDGTLKLWDYQEAKLRQTFYGLVGAPVALAFSPNGRMLPPAEGPGTGEACLQARCGRLARPARRSKRRRHLFRERRLATGGRGAHQPQSRLCYGTATA